MFNYECEVQACFDMNVEQRTAKSFGGGVVCVWKR